MIRSVRIHSPINQGKYEGIHAVLVMYNECVNYFIKRLWSEHKFEGKFLESEYIEGARKRFDLTARLIQCAGKQAFEIAKSQRKKSFTKRNMPRFKTLSATLDSRIWEFGESTSEFEWIKLQSGFQFLIPFKKTVMWNKWEQEGFTLSKSLRVSIRNKKLTLEFFFEKEAPELKPEGETEGLDLGYVNLAVCSDKQVVGKHLNGFIRTFPKRQKNTHKTITNKVFQELKKLDLTNISSLVVENLKYVKHNTREKFSRTHNRRLSHWLYAKVIDWIAMRCEEQGVRLEFKSPYKTSQRCPVCGKWDKRNRNGEKFKCIYCGFECHADRVGSLNLKLLGLAGVYSLRLLNTLSDSKLKELNTCLSIQ
jgi:IS605 OrfB family transposase